jgi:hypothetical protein
MRLAQMERLAARLEFKDWLARHDHDNPSLSDDLAFLTEFHGPWKPKMDRLKRSGLTMIAGGLYGLVRNPQGINQATITGSATEQAIIPIAQTPIEQDVPSSKLYLLVASGTSTTAASAGTYTLAQRIGPAPTNASPLFGAVSGAFTPANSETASQWQTQGFVLIRGPSSTANIAVGSFEWSHSATLAGGGPSTAAGVVGGISASFDSTLTTTALWFGVTHATSTTNTWVPQMVVWASAN